ESISLKREFSAAVPSLVLRRQEFQQAFLEPPVADGKHVILSLDGKALPMRQESRQRLGCAGNIVLGADRHEGRLRDPADLVFREFLARSLDAGRQRLAVAAGLVGKLAKAQRHRI